MQEQANGSWTFKWSNGLRHRTWPWLTVLNSLPEPQHLGIILTRFQFLQFYSSSKPVLILLWRNDWTFKTFCMCDDDTMMTTTVRWYLKAILVRSRKTLLIERQRKSQVHVHNLIWGNKILMLKRQQGKVTKKKILKQIQLKARRK